MDALYSKDVDVRVALTELGRVLLRFVLSDASLRNYVLVVSEAGRSAPRHWPAPL